MLFAWTLKCVHLNLKIRMLRNYRMKTNCCSLITIINDWIFHINILKFQENILPIVMFGVDNVTGITENMFMGLPCVVALDADEEFPRTRTLL